MVILMAEKIKTVDKESWQPRTGLGIKVKNGEITTLEEVLESGKPILEPEIVDILLPDMESENLQIKTTQRVTDSGKRAKFRVVAVIGDKKGHVGLGVGKSDELKPAMDYAVRDAKKHMISVRTGCGSWECKCAFRHSVLSKTIGKEGSTIITLKPAPRGLGLAGNDIVRKVLGMAGVKDVWSSMQGGKNIYNMAVATMKALDGLNTLRPRAE
ncbi:30S ribosomal protein S5 [Candidatus Bilamarchaeum dharawalense]|uniref:30S ribosomal protein S5 n=1 Tax=Candidatus Bilamarchaeum dharawalense TaxID=2885759 RepID=A0A5E4LQ35_9ARCH|nr:30S ribosomal protein S5 [Candidatus Bilamarchaeum dharawalense]